jgi:hypothetical protein
MLHVLVSQVQLLILAVAHYKIHPLQSALNAVIQARLVAREGAPTVQLCALIFHALATVFQLLLVQSVKIYIA